MENEDFDQDQETVGTLGAIRDQLGEMLDPTTTLEAQSYARKFLDKQLESPLAASQKEILTQMEKESRAAQETLRAARAKLLSRQYNPSDRWYSLAKALGAPTRVGGVGELASRAAGALGESNERRRTFEEKRDVEALGYDKEISQLGMDLLKLKSAVGLKEGEIDAGMAKEALKTLGKRLNQQQTNVSKAQQALDREYAKDYLDWVQNGSSVAQKSITELGQARDRLRGYSVNEKGERVPIKEGDMATRILGPTGRVIGSVATVPIAGKAIQDVIAPGSADIRETVESTVQSSLRPILGAQFTEKEGERLIARVYNPRLRPEVNAARVQRLLNQVAAAAANKTAAAKYYEEHGSLAGFKGKYKYTLDDFMPPAGNPLLPEERELDDQGVPYDGPPNPYKGTDEDNNAPAGGPETPSPRMFNGKRVLKLEEFPKRGFAEGGPVRSLSDDNPDTVLAELPDGRLVPVPSNATQEEIVALYGDEGGGDTGGFDSGASRAALAGLGAGVGYAGGRLFSRLGSAVSDLRPGTRETPAQARLLRLMERSNLSPQQITQFQRRFGRLGVPTMPLDFDPNLRAAAETAMTNGGAEAVDLMDRLKARQAEARTRALDQVNKGLKPDEYFSKEQEIKQKLYGDKAKGIESESAPMYKAAFDKNPAIASKQLFTLMETPSGAKAVKAARKTMKDKGLPIGKVNPVTGAVMKPSLEFLNQVKIEMDNLVGAAKTAGKEGKARDVGSLRTKFREELDTATTDPTTGVSPYKEARETYESRKAHLDALQLGREEFGRMQPQEVAKAVQGMNFEQRDAFRTGVAQSIRQMLETPSTDINAAKRLVGSPAMQAKLQSLFDTPHEFEMFRTALAKEVETFENAQQLLNKESTVRKRGAEPPKGRVARGAERAPSLGIFSPTHWALKVLREKPQIKPEEAGEVIKLLRSSTPEEIAEFEKALSSKFGRKTKRKLRGSRMGRVGAALGALSGAFGGGEEEAPVLDEGVLAGLSDEEREAAMQPAMKAEGGKVALIKELIDDLKARYKTMDPEQLKSQLMNVAVKVGDTPANIWRQIVGVPETKPGLPPRIPAQPEALAPFAKSMDAEKARLKQLQLALQTRVDLPPAVIGEAQTASLGAQDAYDTMLSNPTYDNMSRLSEMVRSLAAMAERRKTERARGGRMRRQFGGMTNHA